MTQDCDLEKLADDERLLEMIDSRADPRVVADAIGLMVSYDNGRQMRGACPLHGGDNRSAFSIEYVDRTGNSTFVWRCRTQCSAKGGLVELMRRLRDTSRAEALAAAASLAGVDLSKPLPDETPAEKAARRESREYVSSMMAAGAIVLPPMEKSKWLTEDFVTRCKERGSEYFERRGFDRELLAKFEVGFCPKSDSPWYKTPDPERAVIPIRAHDGALIGVSGRVLGDASLAEEKYRTLMGTTKDYLYNLDKAMPHIQRLGSIIVVEGFANVWALWRAGIHNVVAMMGKDIGPNAFRMLISLTNKVAVALDGDDEGMMAADRLCPDLAKVLNTYRVYLPKGVDLDEVPVERVKGLLGNFRKACFRFGKIIYVSVPKERKSAA